MATGEGAAGEEEATVAAEAAVVADSAAAAAGVAEAVAEEGAVGNALGTAFKVCDDISSGIGLLQYCESSLGAISLPPIMGRITERIGCCRPLDSGNACSSSIKPCTPSPQYD
jgi:hypothetical protein